jgi:hypothetical protein
MRLAMPHPMHNKLSPAEQTQLWQWECDHGIPEQLALRCRIKPDSQSRAHLRNT